MFSKETDKLETFLGMNSHFKGELNVKGTLRVDGKVDGQLDADYVILSENAMVKGGIKAKKVIIGGRVDGDVRALELVEVKSKGKILGDIYTQELVITEGGEFNGKVEMKKGEPKKEESKVIGLELRSRDA
jgi:cytoskeletal protein CcmA (bactofilin family)